MNIHKRCEQNVALNCGVNSAELASKLSEIGLLNTLSKRKSQVVSYELSQIASFIREYLVLLNTHLFCVWLNICAFFSEFSAHDRNKQS